MKSLLQFFTMTAVAKSMRFLKIIAGLAVFGAGGVQAATINTQWNFNDSANATTSVANVGGFTGSFIGGVSRSASGLGVSGTPGDYALSMSGAGAGSMMDATTPGFMSAFNSLAGSQTMSVTFWQNLNAFSNSTAFWGQSTSVGRGFNVHAPWGDQNIYYDTAGCCGPTQRLSGALGAAIGQWELITLVYDNGNKSIYRGTTLINSGGGFAALVTDHTNFFVGNESATAILNPNGRYDNFTLWNGALTPAEIAVLAVRPTPEPSAIVFSAVTFGALSLRRRRS
jgi:hypothetical protein